MCILYQTRVLLQLNKQSESPESTELSMFSGLLSFHFCYPQTPLLYRESTQSKREIGFIYGLYIEVVFSPMVGILEMDQHLYAYLDSNDNNNEKLSLSSILIERLRADVIIDIIMV